MRFCSDFSFGCVDHVSVDMAIIKPFIVLLNSYIQQLRDGVHNFFVTFIEVLRDRPPGHDWELEPGVTCGDYLFGMLQVSFPFTA